MAPPFAWGNLPTFGTSLHPFIVCTTLHEMELYIE